MVSLDSTISLPSGSILPRSDGSTCTSSQSSGDNALLLFLDLELQRLDDVEPLLAEGALVVEDERQIVTVLDQLDDQHVQGRPLPGVVGGEGSSDGRVHDQQALARG